MSKYRTLGFTVAGLLVAIVCLLLVFSVGSPGDSGESYPTGLQAEPGSGSSSQPAVAPAQSVTPLPVRGNRSFPPTTRLSSPRARARTDSAAAAPGALSARFEQERRDSGWAAGKEQSVRDRVQPLLREANAEPGNAVQVSELECRERICGLTVVGRDSRAFVGFVDALQDERGFYGDAAALALDRYEQPAAESAEAGRHQARIYLLYDR